MAKKYAKKRVTHRRKRGGIDWDPLNVFSGATQPAQATIGRMKDPGVKNEFEKPEGAGRRRRKSHKKRRGGITIDSGVWGVPKIEIPVKQYVTDFVKNNDFIKTNAKTIAARIPADYKPSKLINGLDAAKTGATGYLLQALQEAQQGIVAGLTHHGLGRRRRKATKKKSTKRR